LKPNLTGLGGPVALLALLLVAGCTAVDGSSDNPVARKFQWFSFIEGGDFKQTCTPGAPDRYRMIYNGVYTEQVRIYDLHGDTGALDARLIEPMDLKNIEVSSFSDLLNPWRGVVVSRALTTDQTVSVIDALDADGAFGPPAVGVQLPSMGFYWTIAACHNGAYHFTAMAWPSDAWDSALFPSALEAIDPIEQPVNPPRKTKLVRDTIGTKSIDTRTEFFLKVGENGLTGLGPVF